MKRNGLFGWMGLGLAAAVWCALAGGVRADLGQDAGEVEGGEIQAVTAEEWAEVTAPTYGGGNWMTWLEHRGEADGWNGVEPEALAQKRAKARKAGAKASSMGKKVYGWLPYWATSSQVSQFHWDKLTHVAYFSYEVNSADGSCSGMHSWGTNIVKTVKDQGVKIHLTATLFGASGNKALLQNWPACTNLTAKLIKAVKDVNGDGICIDFESVGSWAGATTNLTRFMTNLAEKAKAQGLETAIALPSIDWDKDFDVASYEKKGIIMVIMGYDYHYSGGNPGPVAPLYPSSQWGQTLNYDYSTRYYLGKLTNAADLLMAVPYYGRKWKASSTSLGATSQGSTYVVNPTLSTAASAASSYGRKWDSNGSVPYYVYTDSAGAAWQCFYDDVESLGLKYDYINSKGLGGVGIWALSHEPGTAKFWNLIYEKFGPGTGGGGGTIEDGSAMVSWNFSASEGWASHTSNFTGTTNVAGEAWSLNEARVYPSSTYGGATGDLWLDVPGSYAVTPAIKGVVATQVVLTVRAAANSNLSGRKVGVYYSTDGGSTWTKAGTVSATDYNSLTPSSVKVANADGGANGVKFKLLDESTSTETGTVLVYQMVVKGRDSTTGTLKVTLTPSSAKWSLNGTAYSSGDSISLAAGTYTVTFNALAGYETPAAQSVTIVAGGSKTVTKKYTESSAWTRTIEFASSDGWSAKTDAFFKGNTNVLDETWNAQGLKVNPTVNSQNNIGYVTLDGTNDFLTTPAIPGTITQIVGVVRAGANSNLDKRQVRVEYSLGGGSFQSLAMWSANSYTSSVSHTKTCSLSHASGTKLRFFDSSAGDTNKTTVVLHQIVLKGTKEVAAPDTGTVTCTLKPDGVTGIAKWKIDGTNYSSGATVTVPVGTYTVSFNAVSGYIAPANTNVTVTKNGAKSLSATYTEQPGALTVTLEPAAAASGATWKVSGSSAMHASGETVSLSPGTYTVTFNPLSGYTAPASQSVTVPRGGAVAATGTYVRQTGVLTVNLQPAAVEGAGWWSVDGEDEGRESGTSVTLGTGSHTVTFGPVAGWNAPAAMNVSITSGGSKSVTGTYTVQGAWEKGWDFTTNEGWTARSAVMANLTTNVGGTWKMEGVKIFPTYATNNETGYVVIQQTGNWVELPAFSGCVTQVSAKVRAGADSVLDTRKLTLQYDLGAGWVDWTTWACSSYSNVQSRSKNATVSGGSAGVKLRVIDGSTGDTSKSTVVLHAITVKGNSDAGSASTGTLTATLVPDTATWSVGGQTYESGATATLVAGNHTVTFGAPAGYSAPAASNVTVAVGASKTLKATCTAQPGTLSVTLNPADVRGSAKWKAGGTTNSSGASVSLAAGTYSVSFTAVDGYVTPASQSVTVPAGGSVTESAEYEVKPASLKVTLKPAGGTWKVAGTNHESGATAKLAPGTYAVSFNPQTGYATPASSNVTLTAGQSKSMTVTYPGLAGSVRYVLTPASGTWRINGTNYASGAAAEVPVGTYTVTFGALAGYTAPADETVVVEAEETVERTAAYTQLPGYLCVTLEPAGLPSGARWFANGTGHASGETATLAPGTYAVTFGEVAGWTAPTALAATVEAGKTCSPTGIYVGKPGFVTYTLTPDTGTWTIDGETYASGVTAEVPAGTYTVTFGKLGGYETPAAQSVTVAADQTVAGTASYSVGRVPLTVKLAPTNELPDTARWSIDGTGSHTNAEKVLVEPGTHVLTCNDVPGWTTPAATNVTINAGASSKTVTIKYIAAPGDVTYTLTPPDGTWKINGTTNSSDDVASVPAGEYKVTFGTLKGYKTPTQQVVQVVASGLYQGTAEYELKQVPLTVKLSPTNNAELQASARWSINGIGSYTNAEKVWLDPETYTVSCTVVAGWTTPAATDVTLAVGASSKTLTLTYKIAPARVTYTLSPANATWKINGKTYNSGETAEVPAGTYEVTFNALDGYAAPATQSLTLEAGEEVTRSANYTELPATLTVSLMPATARWTVAGTNHASGATATLAAGTYTVGFGSVSGYVTPTVQNVTLARGEGRELSVEYEPEAVGIPVLQNATGVTTGAFAIAWSGVAGATGYTVQVAEKDTFDDRVALEASFGDATLPAGWAANEKVVFSTDKTAFSGDGKGVAVFTNKACWLRTPKLEMPGRVSWCHAKNTGSGSTTAWGYVLECAGDSDFETIVWSNSFNVSEAVTTPFTNVVDLSGLHDVYLRWRDARASGSAQRYFSRFIAMDGVATTVSTTGTSASFDSLTAGTAYYVRVRAETATGASEWSGVKTVRTEDPPLPPDAPVLGAATGVTESGFAISWSAPSRAEIYHLQVAENDKFDDEPILSCDFTGDLLSGWDATGDSSNNCSLAVSNGSAWVFSASNQYLRTSMVTNPASVTWYHATGSTNAWIYEVQASPTTNFVNPMVLHSVSLAAKVAPTSVTVPLQTAVQNLGTKFYLRWHDRRPSGKAKRYISGISVTGALSVNATGLSKTNRTVSGLAAGTLYYVRVKASGPGGESGWSEVLAVPTKGASPGQDPAFESWLAEKGSSGHLADETAQNDLTYYQNYIADIDPKTTNTLEIVPDATGSQFTVPGASSRRYYQLVYSTNLANGILTTNLGWGATSARSITFSGDWYGSVRVLLEKP